MTLKDRPCSPGRGDDAHQGPGRMRAQCNLVGAGFCFLSLRSRPRKTLLRPHGHPQRAIRCEAKGASGTHTQRQLGLAGSRLFAPAKGSQGPGPPFILFWAALQARLVSGSPYYPWGAWRGLPTFGGGAPESVAHMAGARPSRRLRKEGPPGSQAHLWFLPWGWGHPQGPGASTD